MIANQRVEDGAVHRLEETAVHDGHVHPVRGEQLGGAQGRLAHHADGEDGAVLALPQHLPGAVRHGRDLGGRRRLAGRLVPGIAQRERPVGVPERAAQQPDQLGPVLRRRHRHVRHREQIGDVEQPHVRLPVLADQSRPVHAEDDGQLLNRDVVDDAVVRALQKRRIDRHDGPDALRGKPARERGRMGFGNADVEEAARPFLLEDVRARPRRHRRRDRHEVGMLGRELCDGLAEHLGPLRRPRIDGFELAGDGIVGRPRVVLLEIGLGEREPLPLLGDHVDDARPLERRHQLQRVHHPGDVVARDRAEVAEAQLFEQHPRRPQILDALLDRLGELDQARPPDEVRRFLDHRLDPLADAVGDRARDNRSEVLVDGADVGGDRHPVVVEDHDEIATGVPRVVHRLVRQPARQRPIADDGDDLELLPLQIAAVAIPSAADSPVPAWPAPKWSWGLSVRRRNPLRPPRWRNVGNSALRPVRIFHG